MTKIDITAADPKQNQSGQNNQPGQQNQQPDRQNSEPGGQPNKEKPAQQS
jgi:hypothetical protein